MSLQSTQEPVPTAITTPPPTHTQQAEQQAKIDRLTNITAEWSSGEQHRMDNYSYRPWYMHHWSSPSMFPIMPNYNGQCGYYNNQGWQGNNFDRRQAPEQRSFSQSSYKNNVNNPNLLYVLDGYSTEQALTQMSLNFIQGYDGSNKDAMILWLDHIKMVVENYDIGPLRGRDQQMKRVSFR